jgi:hypothetical protein
MTAVEWLVEILELSNISNQDLAYNEAVFHNAKEMEKQQIIDAYNDGGEKGFNKFGENFEQYYNETYNK